MTAMINAVFTLFCFVGLWCLLFGRYGKTQDEQLGREMVEIRRRLYNWARHYQIPLDDPSYQLLRNAIIGVTRLGRTGMLLSFVWNRDKRPVTFKRRLEEASVRLDEKGKARLLHFRERMNLATFKYLILSPAMMLTVILPLLGLALIKYRYFALVNLFEPAFDRLDDRAVAKVWNMTTAPSTALPPRWKSVPLRFLGQASRLCRNWIKHPSPAVSTHNN